MKQIQLNKPIGTPALRPVSVFWHTSTLCNPSRN